MARMTLKFVHTDDEPRRWPLSERIVDENLGSYHYVTDSLKRVRLATTDPAAVQSQSADLAEDNQDDDAGHAQPDDHVPRRKRVPALGPASDRHRPPGQCSSAERTEAVAPWLIEPPRSHGQSEATSLDGDEELGDAAWLYAWSHEALRPVGE